MKLTANTIPAFLLLAGFASALTVRQDSTSHLLQPRRTKSLLISPAAQPALPTIQEATAAAAAAGLNLDNIQGDILIGMKKNQELFYFFSIADAAAFKPKLASDILPLITTTTQLLQVSTQPTTMLNIAFSATGLSALGITDSLGDADFAGGQFAALTALGDPGSTNWVPQFAGTNIHGVMLFASDTVANIDAAVASVESALGSSITKLYTLAGAVRPGSEAGHEPFGFLDGISNPAVEGFIATPLPGQAPVAAGTILLGESGDTGTRPAWAQDGSFLAFRQLSQLVPEFNKFLTDNPIVMDGLTPQQGSDLLGARMMGRWKSGAPVDLSPVFDDPVLGADPTRNNNFTFEHDGVNLATNQTFCPFAAHIRKTRPRADLGTPEDAIHHIIRAGIPYGPEVSDQEAASNTTTTERGLAFVAYQSNLANGFQFLQQIWANKPNFVHTGEGYDPIVGADAGAPRVVTGLDPTNSTKSLTLPIDFIVSRGGEYFFAPSLSAINTTLSV
ncbi:fungal peroxidase [Roridomyces roridus]|uniref:Fungal peroxidase n=1 Tax=Roridomyces roridus TaxID=1738132 RepID=A0AAD7C3T8_9AGAR|nr:fungal peroxidase [Roridomyces roridus]